MYFTHRAWLVSIGHPSNTPHPVSMRVMMIAFTLLYLVLTLFVYGKTTHYVVLSVILLSIALALYVENKDGGKTNHRYLAIAVVSIILAVFCFILDQRKVFCYPHSIFQLHSMWHLLSGISSFYFYMYARSERNAVQADDVQAVVTT